MIRQHHFYKEVLEDCFREDFDIQKVSSISGGCINNGVQVITDRGDFFIKWQRNLPQDMFAAETSGLKLLREAGEIKVPEVYGYGKIGDRHYLVMEMVSGRRAKEDYWERFGRLLAGLHLHTHKTFGLSDNNYIGKLPQCNEWMSDWVDFFIQRRLEVQLTIALKSKLVDDSFAIRFRKVYKQLPALLPPEQPALLHGDLWSGNVITGADGNVCIIDPAVYYGHREIEISFTRLFGGFDSTFYQAYQEAYPLLPGFDNRIDIYNLYPLLVHVNLFGTSYLSGIRQTIRKLQ